MIDLTIMNNQSHFCINNAHYLEKIMDFFGQDVVYLKVIK